MEKVASGVFTTKIGTYLARASKGERFLITSYGRPYVVLGPATDDVLAELADDEGNVPQE